jgi:hypothetical protein
MSGEGSGSHYGMGPYGRGKYSRATGFNDAGIPLAQPSGVQLSADLLPITPNRLDVVRTQTRVLAAGIAIRVGFHHIAQPASVQISGQILWQKVAVPACAPWTMVGTPASWSVLANSAGAMFP